MKHDTNMFLLLQMADSAFPVGGFAYSYGLESAIKHNFITNEKDLRAYLIVFAEQIIAFDFPFVYAAHAHQNAPENIPVLRTMIHSYKVMLMNPPLHKAGCVMGRNWLKICKQISDNLQIDATEELFQKESLSYEFPVVFGMCMKAMNFSLAQTHYLFFYMALRDQISALIRLGSAGPSMAHTELQYILHHFSDTIYNHIPVDYPDAYKSAYLLELAQLSHERVYSKLFQN